MVWNVSLCCIIKEVCGTCLYRQQKLKFQTIFSSKKSCQFYIIFKNMLIFWDAPVYTIKQIGPDSHVCQPVPEKKIDLMRHVCFISIIQSILTFWPNKFGHYMLTKHPRTHWIRGHHVINHGWPRPSLRMCYKDQTTRVLGACLWE